MAGRLAAMAEHACEMESSLEFGSIDMSVLDEEGVAAAIIVVGVGAKLECLGIMRAAAVLCDT